MNRKQQRFQAAVAAMPKKRTRRPSGANDLPIEIISELLEYDASTGEIWFRAKGKPNPGSPPTGSKCNHGYLRISIRGKLVFAHRIAYALWHGEWPSGLIDHINGDKADNRICNLRVASNAENQWNRSKPKTNSSGHKGVHFHKAKNKWMARICYNGNRVYLGSFLFFDEAVEAYRAAAPKVHGEFTNLN